MKMQTETTYFKVLATYAFGVRQEWIYFHVDEIEGIASAEYLNVMLIHDRAGYHVYIQKGGVYFIPEATNLQTWEVPGAVKLALKESTRTTPVWKWKVIKWFRHPLTTVVLCAIAATLPFPPPVRFWLVIVAATTLRIVSEKVMLWVLR